MIQPGMDVPMETGADMPPVEEAMPQLGGDIESALAGVEAAAEGLAPDVAEEVRSHVNAIREAVSKDAGPAEALGSAPLAPEGEVPEEPKIQL